MKFLIRASDILGKDGLFALPATTVPDKESEGGSHISGDGGVEVIGFPESASGGITLGGA